MAGLLDLNDPQSMGLLSLGLRLMSTPGKFGAALGTAGMGALGDMQQAQARQQQSKQMDAAERMRALQEQMTMLQLAQAKQQQARQQGIEGAYRGAIETPATQALAGGGGPTVANAAKLPGLQPRVNQDKLVQGLMQVDPMAAYGLMQPKPKEYKVVNGSLIEIGADGVKEAYRAPDAADDKDVALLELLHGKGTPAFFAAAQKLADKRTTHAPAASAVSYGSPVPVMLPNGGIGYAQPPNRPGAAPQLMADPSGKPMVKPPDASTKPTGEQNLAAGYAARMEEASKLVSKFETEGRPGYLQQAAGAIGDNTRALVSRAVQQQYRQAQEDWVRAKLRKESGAAIPADEMDREIAAYFPLPSERDPAVIAQKTRARLIANEAMKRAAGGASYTSEVDNMSKDDPLGLRGGK